MKDFKILKFLDKLSFIYKKFGVDYELMRKILVVKLIMDGRRVPSVLSNNKNTKERDSFTNTMIAYGITGVFIALFMFIRFPIYIKMSIIFGMIIFMIMATMVSDFSSVLLNLDDKNILLSRPVEAKTLNAAKITHICIYLFTLTAVMAGPSIITFGMNYGVAEAVVFLIQLFFIGGFVIFFTAILYFLVLLFFDGEKLKDIINYFQIFLSIVMIISYQLIGRMFDISKLNIVIRPSWWHYLIPSMWFAAPYSYFFENHHQSYYLGLSVMGVLIPVLALIIYIKYVTKYFEKYLQKLNNNSGRKARQIERKESFQRKLSDLVCRNKIESTFYRFSRNMIANERKLKLKIYPSIAYGVIFPFIFLFGMFREYHSISGIIKEISSGKYYLSIYASIAMLVPSILIISRSEDYNGAWIYKALPIETPSHIFKGAIKAFMLRCIIPVELFVSLLFLVLCGPKILPQIILIFLNMICISLLLIIQSGKVLPFSRDFKITTDNNAGSTIILMVVCGVLAGIEAYVDSYLIGTLIYIAAAVIAVNVLWRKAFKINWKDIDNS